MTNPTRFQFSLRTLLLAVTTIAVVLSLTMWLHELGLAISLLSLGIVLVGVGIWSKRKSYVIGGCVLIGGLVISAPWLLVAICWVGNKTISVTVRVQDQAGTPIANATVQLTGRDGTSTASTDASGVASVVGEFMTCGRDSLLRKTGGFQLFRHQLTARAKGYKVFQRQLDEAVGRLSWDMYTWQHRQKSLFSWSETNKCQRRSNSWQTSHGCTGPGVPRKNRPVSR